MTIKTGPIKLGADGAAELGLPVTGKLTLGDARVRQLAGKPSGPLKLSDLQGKTRPPPYGTLLSTFCSGYTKMGRYADGNYGSYDAVIANNSPECGWNPPPRGTFIRQYCRGYTLIGVYADGSYGTYESVTANNSPTCGYVPPPAYGTLLSTFCASRYDLWECMLMAQVVRTTPLSSTVAAAAATVQVVVVLTMSLTVVKVKAKAMELERNFI